VQDVAVLHDSGAWLATQHWREVGRIDYAAVVAVGSSPMLGEQLRIAPDDDTLAMHTHRHGRTHVFDAASLLIETPWKPRSYSPGLLAQWRDTYTRSSC
jgi:hypothetical protein